MDGAAAFSLAKTSVWWDIENCKPPSDVNPFDIAKNISNCLHAFNFVGPLSISAYGDTHQLTRHVQNALTSTGIALNHIPSGRKEASDKAIVMNMAFWTSDNPPPANVLLISGDQDFSPLLHCLQMKRFNVLLARPEGVNVTDSLLNSAKTVWYWSRLARAEITSLPFPRATISHESRAPTNPLYPPPIARPPPGFRAPAPRPQEMVYYDVRPQQHSDIRPQQHFNRARAPAPAPAPAPASQVQRPFFLQWPASPKCFSGVAEKPRQQQPQVSPEFANARPIIRRALETLSREMMLPTESNIYNCIVFGQKHSLTFNLYLALEQGVKAGELVVRTGGVGAREKVYLPAGMELWPYVDPNLCHEYDADIWSDFRSFLCGEEAHAFVNSSNHYHAALVLRAVGLGRLSDLALAQIYNVIQLAIIVRLWIKPHRNWSPLTITIARSTLAGAPCTAALEEKAVDVVHQSSAASPEFDHFEKTAFEVVNKVLEEPSSEVNRKVRVDEAKELNKATSKTDVIVKEVMTTKGKKEKPVSIIRELRAWLPSMLTAEGYDISLVRQDFKAAKGITLDHQALGYPKLLDIMRKNSDVVQISSPRPGLFKLYPPGTVVVQEKVREKASPAETLEKLRSWLPTFIAKRGVCDLTSLCREFEKDCKMKLVASSLGFSSAGKLLEQFPDAVRVEQLQSGDIVVTSARKKEEEVLPEEESEEDEDDVEEASAEQDPAQQMTNECQALLLEIIPKSKGGVYPVARLKEDFQVRYGYSLDHSGCGYKKLEGFLERMKDQIGIKTGPGGHKLLYLKEGVMDSAAEEEQQAARSKNSKKSKKVEAGKQQGMVPVLLRYGYVERVAESRIGIKLNNSLCMVD